VTEPKPHANVVHPRRNNLGRGGPVSLATHDMVGEVEISADPEMVTDVEIPADPDMVSEVEIPADTVEIYPLLSASTSPHEIIQNP